MSTRNYYIDNLGKQQTRDVPNYISELKSKLPTVNARYQDSNTQKTNHYITLLLFSTITGISIIVLLILLKQLNKN